MLLARCEYLKTYKCQNLLASINETLESAAPSAGIFTGWLDEDTIESVLSGLDDVLEQQGWRLLPFSTTAAGQPEVRKFRPIRFYQIMDDGQIMGSGYVEANFHKYKSGSLLLDIKTAAPTFDLATKLATDAYVPVKLYMLDHRAFNNLHMP